MLYYLDPISLHSFSATNRFHRRLFLHHNVSSIHSLLRYFVLDPSALLSLLHSTNSIISGSTATLAFLPHSFTPNDLDIYVPAKFLDTFVSSLRVKFGYKKSRPVAAVTGHIEKDYSSLARIERILWFKRGEKTINVMAVNGHNAVVPVFSFHSTIVMNFISAYGFYCAYPSLTLSSRSIINTKGTLPRPAKRAIKKYKERGIKSAYSLSTWRRFNQHNCMKSSICPQSIRSLYDNGGLFRSFSDIKDDATDRIFPLRYNKIDSVVWTLHAGRFCSEQTIATSGFVKSTTIIHV